MSSVDFLIANNGHHAETARTVAHELLRRGLECRLVSICELRGLDSPQDETLTTGLGLHRLVPHRIRRSPSLRGGAVVRRPKLRALSHLVLWHGYLKRRVRAWLRQTPRLVTVPNDAAFPYSYICRELRKREIPFVLLQEGIRFTETVFEESGILEQGRSGANAIACWGATSAEFFRQRGAPTNSVHLTGNPRFDHIAATDWSPPARHLDKTLPSGQPTVSILTNPIDLWGFCSNAEKMRLIESFIEGLADLFETTDLRLILKNHRQESFQDYKAVAANSGYPDRIAVVPDAPLYPLLRLSDAAVILASTVGLEALLLGVPLAVLEVPGTGFIHDFVSGGAARGITWSRPLATQVEALIDGSSKIDASVMAYLDRTLSARGRATQAVGDLLEVLAQNEPLVQ